MLPITVGSNPEIITIQPNQWVRTHSNVNIGVITNLTPSSKNDVYMTYLKADLTMENTPTTFEEVPSWQIHKSPVRFQDEITKRDLFVFSKTLETSLRLEA